MKFLAAILSSSILVACGSGGGGSDAPASPTTESPTTPSPAIEALAQFEGVWREDCNDHMRVTKTSTATSGTTFSVVTREDYYDNADCTGALVATGSYGVPDETVTYAPTLANASVTLLTGENIQADVAPATSVAAVATFTVTGSGVKATELVGTTLFARIEYANGDYLVMTHPGLGGQTTYGAFLIRKYELLALLPIDGFTNSFKVRHRYTR
ncbi:MAG: hypothetical protein GZ093_07610 [Rhodoferax sp.]|uniref:hypothetical protein n=1 Tax=Rhodoferax sp. TaxID=50421 RepID=UPI001401ACA1|nr:hypothetical protein [Rhodoferax sp.]NDP38604.1 hypothetical protein [Rhodoferax sp.]